LRLVGAIPPAIRDAVEEEARSAGREGSFRRAALALVSRPEAIAWARSLVERVPALGVGAGPACIVRLWVVGLLRPDGAVERYWPDLVGYVWRVVGPALRMVGLGTRGPQGEELRHEVASPLAWVFLGSLAAGRKDLRLLDVRALEAKRPDGPPFGWAPGMDPLGSVLRYLLMDQVPRLFRSHAFLASPLARLLRELGLARSCVFVWRRCFVCRAIFSDTTGSQHCPHCGNRLVVCRRRRLVAVPSGQTEGGETQAADPLRADSGIVARFGGDGGVGRLAVPERVEARLIRRRCLDRAFGLWARAVQGGRHGVAATVVLGALAGVRPLASLADRPTPRREWLEALVSALAEEHLEREGVAACANAALETVASRLGRRRPPAILAAYVGVLATRFRQAVFRGAT
jgi:hypothetical protein